MTYPQVISNDSSNTSATWASFTLEKTTDVSLGSDFHIYQFVKPNGSLLSDGRIKVQISTSTWSDHDPPHAPGGSNTNAPYSVDNGASGVKTVQALPTYSNLFSFTDTYGSSSSSSSSSSTTKKRVNCNFW